MKTIWMIDTFRRLISFLDRHSGAISAVGLVLAAGGVLLNFVYTRMYAGELSGGRVEVERLAWERILKLLNQVIEYATAARMSSVNHSPLVKVLGFLPADLAAKYESAAYSLLSYWHQLRVEVSLMPHSSLVGEIESFMSKYSASADARASEQFGKDITPIVLKVNERARKSFSSS
jgi:hypothetical protein